jgi:hypothetical protein
MGGKAERFQTRVDLILVIARIQTHPLRVRRGWFWTLHHQTRHGHAHQRHIMPIGALNREADWDPMSLCQQAAFDTGLAPVGGIGPGFFPRPAVLWSVPHPSPANPTRSHTAHQTAGLPLAIISEKPRLPPRLETDRAPSNAHTAPSGPGLATGTRSARHRRWHPRRCDPTHAVVLPQSDAY